MFMLEQNKLLFSVLFCLKSHYHVKLPSSCSGMGIGRVTMATVRNVQKARMLCRTSIIAET